MPGWATVRIDDHEAAATATQHLLDLGHRADRLRRRRDRGRARLHRAVGPARRLPLHPRAAPGCRCCAGARGGRRVHRRRRPARRAGRCSRGRTGRPRSSPPPTRWRSAPSGPPASSACGCPEDVSVIGIDDHEMASYFDLTTVAQPVHEQGRVAAAQVLAALGDEDWRPGAGDPADRAARPAYDGGSVRPHVGEVGDVATGGDALALELGHRPLGPALHHAALEQRLGVEDLDHLLGVVGPVGGQPPLGAGREPSARPGSRSRA